MLGTGYHMLVLFQKKSNCYKLLRAFQQLSNQLAVAKAQLFHLVCGYITLGIDCHGGSRMMHGVSARGAHEEGSTQAQCL